MTMSKLLPTALLPFLLLAGTASANEPPTTGSLVQMRTLIMVGNTVTLPVYAMPDGALCYTYIKHATKEANDSGSTTTVTPDISCGDLQALETVDIGDGLFIEHLVFKP